MSKYIDADKLIAEIERRIEETKSMTPTFDQFISGQISAFKGALKIVKSLQQDQPEELEKEIDRELDTRWKGEYLSTSKFRESARHFFELGRNARKEKL